MKIHRIILIALGLFFMVSITAAADLTPSTMVSSNLGWIIANGNDQVTIIVHVMQGSPATDVSGANVVFSLVGDSQDLGTLSSPSATTGIDGIAQTVFRSKTKSGTVTINATVTSTDGTILPISCTQRIDHDIPSGAVVDYPLKVTAGSVTQIVIPLTDISNNPVDNKNTAEIHNIVLHMSGDGGAGFLQGTEYVQDLTVPTDGGGNASVDLRVSTLAGPNNIQIYPIGSYLGGLVTITGVADSDPCYLVQLHPSPSSWPADGKDPEHSFIFYWTVLDKNHNPIGYADLWVTTSKPGEEVHLITGPDGIASTPYGAKSIAGIYTITATPVVPGTTTAMNATLLCTDTLESGFCSQTVEFTALDPVDMFLTASPQTMVSMDVDGAKPVDVKARVVDVSGNAVKGETVIFTKSADTLTYTKPDGTLGTFAETVSSSLTPPTTVTTAMDSGYATVQFLPGTFAKKGETGYDEAATGSCKVTATWTNGKTGEVKTREITFVWKNYPFLTVESEIDNLDPNVGDIINVKIWIKGTGAALQPKPIDVVLCNDRSGSMLLDYPDRMVQAKDAALTFSSKLTEGKDHIGLVSFGDNDGESGWAKLAPTKSGSSWSWDHVYGSWYWVADDSAYECGNGCPGYYYNKYDPASPHQLYLNAHYNAGKPKDYGDNVYASNDLVLNLHTLTEVTGGLDGIVPAGGTPTREGLYNAVSQFPAYSTERPVRAIILLTDGKWNTGGDPESIKTSPSIKSFPDVGTGSIIAWANSKKIKIFTIGLGSDVSSDELTRYATDTGGKYYPASDPTQLATIYTDIAGALNEQAGGQTQLKADFGKITVDGNAVTGDAVDEYLEYVYNPGGGASSSTLVKKYTEVPVIPPKNQYYEYVRDDTGNWTNPTLIPGLTPKQLDFDVGKIILNDIWMANIQFEMKKAGAIGIFGDQSPVTFIDTVTGKSQTVTVPSKIWTIHPGQADNPFGTPTTLTVTDVLVTPVATDPNLMTVSWKIGYDGDKHLNEKLLYCSETSSNPVSCAASQNLWPAYANLLISPPAGNSGTYSFVIDTSTLKPGDIYRITVRASESTPGGKENSGSALYSKGDVSTRAFIKLE
ncbi:MAG: hypothetical protein CVV30_08285 [Methanomicrobiales archaeon HGW-Methanomicrobiales-1]|nr:MAG: hypothetical protein CVV30_08285 [Methanomicrobiales archaeon HGW-Methanomicrobiales-1]